MKNKHLLALIFILAVILITIIIFLFNIFTKPTEIVECSPYLNINSTIKSGDLTVCDCLNDEDKVKDCQNTIINAGNFTSAIQKSDLSQCEDISDKKMKDTCVQITQGKIDFANKSENSNLTATSSKK
jgi:hypothetical protein